MPDRTADSAPLPRGLLLAYGQLGLPLAVLALPLYVLLPAFYADSLGLGLATVGTVLLAARIWDVMEPAEQAQYERWGREIYTMDLDFVGVHSGESVAYDGPPLPELATGY